MRKQDIVDLVVELRILEKSTTDDDTRIELSNICEDLQKRYESMSDKNLEKRWPDLKLSAVSSQSTICEQCLMDTELISECARTECPQKMSGSCGL